MFAKTAVLALAACLIIGTVVAKEGNSCNSEINVYLSAEAMTCTEGIPAQRFYNPRLQAVRCFNKQLSKAACTMDKVPEYLESCLENVYVADSIVTSAKSCMQNAVSIFL